ncbi:3-deoxy-7-phosphoheptulonate synthase [Streptomyces sp. SBT349]|uniref:3-deoxy-7-phosphoheptulonate synthase n=1 Tax=Streptomyces sp. SBT349 TaxID=1580539 RepID=UPI0007C6F7EA|nr:3-deoxy-7-phosphoheptulonate synthase [Streptomyces sp. SBT349]
MTTTDETWWRRAARQQPDWPDRGELAEVVRSLRAAPPLVHARECDALRGHLAAVARGRAAVLQGGDCAETFDAVNAASVGGKVRVLRRASAVIGEAASIPVLRIGRIAGQFAKPRSAATETRHGVELPAYRGDAVNGFGFTPADRRPDPRRLRRAYDASARTLGLLREAGATVPTGPGALDADTTGLFTSHEALLLDYESPLARPDAAGGGIYATSGHMLWIGERTRQLDGAHVEFAARVANPLGVKIGPDTTSDDVMNLIERLNPDRVPGRLSFIPRMGADRVRDRLPVLVEKAEAAEADAVWICDPMHGNTYTSAGGHKTRAFDRIVEEVTGFFDVHQALGTHPGGVHLEFTGERVTECVGGRGGVTESGLGARYTSTCDPRLNPDQALELASVTADLYARRGRRRMSPTDAPAGPTGCVTHGVESDRP